MEGYISIWDLALSLGLSPNASIIYLPIYNTSAVKTLKQQISKSYRDKFLNIFNRFYCPKAT